MDRNERAELYGRTLEQLQHTWGKNLHLTESLHDNIGIRSTQIGSLLLMLIDLGLITEEALDSIGQ